MHVPPEIKTHVQNIVNQCVQKANVYFGRKYSIPSIHYDIRGTKAGNAHNGEVHFNPIILMENVEDFLFRTVPHEVAHIIDTANGDNARPSNDAYHVLNAVITGRRVRRRKRSIHGASWEIICRIFGMKDISRCHHYDTTSPL